MADTLNFFQAEDKARGATSGLVLLLVVIFAASFVILTWFMYYVVHFYQVIDPKEVAHFEDFDPGALARAVFIVLLIMGGGSLMRSSGFGRSGAALAVRLGGRLVGTHTVDLGERKYLNVVEEMALASGMPVPLCFVIPGDNTINAFAAGSTLKDAVICITQGSLTQLTRDELQCVVAHEFSHIGNGDMKLNMQVIRALAGLTAIGAVGLACIKASKPHVKSDYSPDNLIGAFCFSSFGAVILVIGAPGAFFARIIQAAVAYQRQYLADASAVQFTRNPLALASALKKAASSARAERRGSSSDLESQHLFFVSSGDFIDVLISAHPPILARIKRIDPAFDRGDSED
jgi:Zn-dependent protease with chaperone function